MNMHKWPAKVTAAIALLIALGLIVMSSGVLGLITGPATPPGTGIESAARSWVLLD
ncbi:hypothetical protein M2368_002956 [Arthrobacter sp. JUb119]|uniref:hypothetical protein n=1 Tax=Actinomycetes TaxID=1760 RepID=UPI000F9D7FF8|nr:MULTISPECIES: hypothetical protein [unclassified Arthrobacter]MCS3493932.1 hypothetical protein [Arthrobacter sp. JUb119]TDU26984.1 hypothetical protein EDF61_10455 [Arthrobacter sp. JUb115]